jgi:hypothetical protein
MRPIAFNIHALPNYIEMNLLVSNMTHVKIRVRFQFLKVVIMTAFWDTWSCGVLKVGWRYWGVYCSHHQGDESVYFNETAECYIPKYCPWHVNGDADIHDLHGIYLWTMQRAYDAVTLHVVASHSMHMSNQRDYFISWKGNVMFLHYTFSSLYTIS